MYTILLCHLLVSLYGWQCLDVFDLNMCKWDELNQCEDRPNKYKVKEYDMYRLLVATKYNSIAQRALLLWVCLRLNVSLKMGLFSNP